MKLFGIAFKSSVYILTLLLVTASPAAYSSLFTNIQAECNTASPPLAVVSNQFARQNNVANIQASPDQDGLRKIQATLAAPTQGQLLVCVQLTPPIKNATSHNNQKSISFYPAKTKHNTDSLSQIIDIDPTYSGKISIAAYDWVENKKLKQVAYGEHQVTATKQASTYKCDKASITQFNVSTKLDQIPIEKMQTISLVAGSLNRIHFRLPNNSASDKTSTLCLQLQSADMARHISIVEGASQIIGSDFHSIIDVGEKFQGNATAYLLNVDQQSISIDSPDPHELSATPNILNKIVMTVEAWVGIKEKMRVCNSKLESTAFNDIQKHSNMLSKEEIVLRSGGIRRIDIPLVSNISSEPPIVCLLSDKENLQDNVRFIRGQEYIKGNRYFTYLDIDKDFSGNIDVYLYRQGNYQLVSNSDIDDLIISDNDLGPNLYRSTRILIKPKWEYFIKQGDNEIQQSLLPYQEVYLWYPEKQVSIKIKEENKHNESNNNREQVVAEQRVEHNVNYFVYNLGDFDPDKTITLSLAEANTASEHNNSQWHVPNRRMFVRPHNYSLRFGKGLVQKTDRAPEFASLYVRLWRFETLNSSLGATTGLSVDKGNKVYFVGGNAELYDAISLTVGLAAVEEAETSELSDMKGFFGLSADIRLVTDFFSGISKMYSGNN
jgi:hypothetical protein